MPQKQQGFENTADSIFDFIFTNANQKVRPSKPMKPSKATGNAMADGLAEIATRPIAYAGEQITAPLHEALNAYKISLNEFDTTKHSKFKAEISLSNVLEFYSDPDGFLDKVFAKEEFFNKSARTMNMVRGFGGYLDLASSAVLAKKMGLSSKEAIQIGWELNSEKMSSDIRDYQIETNAAVASTSVALNGLNLSGLGYSFSSKNSTTISKDFYHVLDSTRIERSRINEKDASGAFLLSPSDKKTEYKRILKKRLNELGYTDETLNDNLIESHLALIRAHCNSEQVFNSTAYVDHWAQKNDINVDDGLTSRQKREKKAKEGIDIYHLTSGGKEWTQSQYPTRKYMSIQLQKYSAEIEFLDNEIRKVSSTGRSTTELEAKRDKLQTKFWFTCVKLRSDGANMTNAKIFGEIYMHGQAFNTILQGGGLSTIVSGDFFDPGKNHWSPSKEQKDINIKASPIGDIEGIKLKIPKNEKSKYFLNFTSLYYFTPGSIGKTLFVNGEGFVYLAYLRELKMKNLIENSLELYFKVSRIPDLATIAGGRTGSVAVLEQLAREYDRTLAALEGSTTLGLDLTILRNQLRDLNDKIKNSWGMRYSKRLRDFWNMLNNMSLTKKVREALLKVMTAFLGPEAAARVMAGNIGLKGAIHALVSKAGQKISAKLGLHIIAQKLGLVFSAGTLSALIYIVTEVVYWITVKLLKPAIKVSIYVVVGIPLLIVALLFNACSFINPIGSQTKKLDVAAHTPPTECVTCGDWWVSDMHNEYGSAAPRGYVGSAGVFDWDTFEGIDAHIPTGDWLWPVSNCRGISRAVQSGHIAVDVHSCGDVSGRTWDEYHSPSNKILASRAGRVSRITTGWGNGYGNRVEIDHGDGYSTLYAHMHSIAPQIQNGVKVEQGDVLGIMGNTGDSRGATGVHLHFEIRVNGRQQNPCRFNEIKSICNAAGYY